MSKKNDNVPTGGLSPQETHQEDRRQEDSRPEDSRQENSRQEDSRQEDSRQEDSRQEDSRQEDSRQENCRTEDSRQEDSRPEDSRQEDSRQEEGCQENCRQEEGIKFNIEDRKYRIVLMGKTGTGKSSTGNTVMSGDDNLQSSDKFKVSETGADFTSVTQICQLRCCERFGVELQLVDTPGFFDTEEDDEEKVDDEIMRSIGMTSPGPHVLLLTVRLDTRFTKEEAETVEKMKDFFGSNIMRHVIIVFTHGDSLQSDAVEEILKTVPTRLKQLLQDVDNRYVVFNNSGSAEEKDEQVRQLLQAIRDKLDDTGGLPFSNDFLAKCEDALMRKATQLKEILGNTDVPKSLLQRLIRASLESHERGQKMLFTLKDKLHITEEENRSLKELLKESKKLHLELNGLLQKEKKKKREMELETKKKEKEKEKLEKDIKDLQEEKDKLKKEKEQFKKERDDAKREKDNATSTRKCQII